MNITNSTFDFHVDAKYFGFQWKEAMFINVEYMAWKRDDDVVVSIGKISAPPYLLGSIVMHDNWLAVDNEITAAAKSHAMEQFRNQHVDETIMSAIAPHII